MPGELGSVLHLIRNTVDGAKEILIRQAIAAVLNACAVEYPILRSQIEAEVNAALCSFDRDTILGEANRLGAFNDLGCPLGGH